MLFRDCFVKSNSINYEQGKKITVRLMKLVHQKQSYSYKKKTRISGSSQPNVLQESHLCSLLIYESEGCFSSRLFTRKKAVSEILERFINVIMFQCVVGYM